MKHFRIETLPGTPLGSLHFALSEMGLAGLAFDGPGLSAWQRRFSPGLPFAMAGALAAAVGSQLQEYFSGQRRGFDIPLDLSGLTFFQRQVLSAVSEIPFGETRTYLEIANHIGRLRAYRAVGQANAANPIAIVIPCHRLIGARGSLRGYRGGLERKAWLLAHERG